MVNFETVWQRIKAHQGQTFQQIRGAKFTYAINGDVFNPSRTNQNISKAHFLEAFGKVPLLNTVEVQHLRGPSYLFAVLMDSRIRLTDW